MRTQGGMAPTAKAQRLAKAVDLALTTIDVAIRETDTYEPARSDRAFRLHMSDIGETIFLPPLLQSTRARRAGVRLEAFQLDDDDFGRRWTAAVSTLPWATFPRLPTSSDGFSPSATSS